mgnify:CR=1 FL=1
MRTKLRQNDNKPAKQSPIKYDAQAIANIAMEVKSQGFVPRSVLDEKFGPDKVTQGIAVLYRDFRMFREVRRPWKDDQDALGYEWADKRFSNQETKKIPPTLGFVLELTSGLKQKYGDFEPVRVHCRYTTPILGSVPVKDKEGDPTNRFERDAADCVLILPYHQRAMASMALPMIGKEQAVARRIGWSTIRIKVNGNLKIVEHGIVDPSGYGGGKGLRRSESLVDPIEFTIHANVPTSALSIEEFLRMVRTAGQFVRLSPGRSAGFGEFEVLSAE